MLLLLCVREYYVESRWNSCKRGGDEEWNLWGALWNISSVQPWLIVKTMFFSIIVDPCKSLHQKKTFLKFLLSQSHGGWWFSKVKHWKMRRPTKKNLPLKLKLVWGISEKKNNTRNWFCADSSESWKLSTLSSLWYHNPNMKAKRITFVYRFQPWKLLFN